MLMYLTSNNDFTQLCTIRSKGTLYDHHQQPRHFLPLHNKAKNSIVFQGIRGILQW